MRTRHHLPLLLAGGLLTFGLAAAATVAPAEASADTGSPAAPAVTTSLPHVASVVFNGVSGGSASPTITVTGTGFGTEPTGHPDTCSTYTGDYYNQNFYFWDDTTYWESGLSGDCIGIVISSWTADKIVFGFGSGYGTGPDYSMYNGDNYALKVRSFMWGGVVNGLS
jgi:hypothetical protein